MTQEIGFMAPTGCGPIKLFQEAEDGWGVLWRDQTDPDTIIDYSDDPPEADWESVEFRTGEAQRRLSVWIDGAGDCWLSHHLLPDTARQLSPEAIALARREFAAARALDRADRLILDLAESAKGAPKPPKGRTGPNARLIDQAERLRDVCRENAEQLRRAFMGRLETDHAAGRGVAIEQGE